MYCFILQSRYISTSLYFFYFLIILFFPEKDLFINIAPYVCLNQLTKRNWTFLNRA